MTLTRFPSHLAVLVLAFGCLGCNSATTESETSSFVCKEGGYKIDFPETPVRAPTSNFPGKTAGCMHMVEQESPKKLWHVTVGRYSSRIEDQDELRDMFGKELSSIFDTEVTEKKMTFLGHEARQLEFVNPKDGSKMVSRVFLTDYCVYQLQFATEEDKFDIGEAEAFFDTFELLEQ